MDTQTGVAANLRWRSRRLRIESPTVQPRLSLAVRLEIQPWLLSLIDC
jgi:hypothetical protein